MALTRRKQERDVASENPVEDPVEVRVLKVGGVWAAGGAGCVWGGE